MQLYLKRLTHIKVSVFFSLKLLHRMRLVIAVWPSVGAAAGSALKSRVSGEFLILQKPKGRKNSK